MKPDLKWYQYLFKFLLKLVRIILGKERKKKDVS